MYTQFRIRKLEKKIIPSLFESTFFRIFVLPNLRSSKFSFFRIFVRKRGEKERWWLRFPFVRIFLQNRLSFSFPFALGPLFHFKNETIDVSPRRVDPLDPFRSRRRINDPLPVRVTIPVERILAAPPNFCGRGRRHTRRQPDACTRSTSIAISGTRSFNSCWMSRCCGEEKRKTREMETRTVVKLSTTKNRETDEGGVNREIMGGHVTTLGTLIFNLMDGWLIDYGTM